MPSFQKRDTAIISSQSKKIERYEELDKFFEINIATLVFLLGLLDGNTISKPGTMRGMFLKSEGSCRQTISGNIFESSEKSVWKIWLLSTQLCYTIVRSLSESKLDLFSRITIYPFPKVWVMMLFLPV